MRQSSFLSSFKGESRSAISESNQGLGDLTKTAKALPSTIRISSGHVRHNADNDNGGSSYDIKGKGEEVLADIISSRSSGTFYRGITSRALNRSQKDSFRRRNRSRST